MNPWLGWLILTFIVAACWAVLGLFGAFTVAATAWLSRRRSRRTHQLWVAFARAHPLGDDCGCRYWSSTGDRMIYQPCEQHEGTP